MNCKSSIYLLIPLFIALAACRSKNIKDDFTGRTAKQWSAYLEEIGVENPDLSEHVILILHVTSCAPCQKELDWWVENESDINRGLKVSAIVIENYKSIFKTFVDKNNLTMPVYQDSAALIFEYKLIGYPPAKVYFNEDKDIVAYERMGSNGKLKSFLNKISASGL